MTLLDSPSHGVLANALEAAKPALQGQTEMTPLVDKLVALADSHPEPAARLEALNALQGIKDFQQQEKIAAVFLKNIQAPEPYLKSLALFRIQFNNHKLAGKEEFFTRVHDLLKDPDPGVRGRAAEVSSVLVADADKEKLGAEITAMLEDKEAYVRSASASALGRLGYKPAIPKMVALLDDKARNTYDIPYKRLNGKEGSEHHDGSAWSRVDDSMLWGLSQLTFGFGEQKFPYGKIDWKNVDGDIAREVKLAKAWYDKNKALLK
jgi:HEAT repeat protein